MQNLENEKQRLREAVEKIKQETSEKRQRLIKEKEKVEGVKNKIDDLEKEKREILRTNEENKELKNTMLQRIRGKNIFKFFFRNSSWNQEK